MEKNSGCKQVEWFDRRIKIDGQYIFFKKLVKDKCFYKRQARYVWTEDFIKFIPA